MQEGSNSSRADRIRKPLLVPGNSSSDHLSGDSPTAYSVDTYIQIDADAARLHTDGADPLTLPRHPFAEAAASQSLANGALHTAQPAGASHLLPRPEGIGESAGSSGGEVVMDVNVLTTQEPVTATGTASGKAVDGDGRSPSVSPQPTRESGHGDVPTDVEEVALSGYIAAHRVFLRFICLFLDGNRCICT